jgi:hypothetical protein
MRSQAELDALGTAFVKDMLAGIGEVSDLGGGLLQVTEKPPESDLQPNVTWNDRKDRLKGHDVSVQLFIDGKPAERLGPFVSIEAELRDNDYLGKTTTKYNSIFKGCVMKCEWKLTSKHGLRPLLEGAWSERTRTGAWLVFGKGPRRRYSTKALAEREVQRRRRARNGKAP